MEKFLKYYKHLLDLIFNIITNHKLIYIVEDGGWSIMQDGLAITSSLKEKLEGRISLNHLGSRNKIIHFGSINTFYNKNGIKNVHPSNKVIVTWFHIEENDFRLKNLNAIEKSVDLLHTSCQMTKEILIKNGFNEKKIKVIPIPVDTDLFKPAKEDKKIIRKKLSLPLDKFIIGSFQKDGTGWEEGIEPKLIKGPDIFCDQVKIISEKLGKDNIHVLLTGPARGYVKNRLSKDGISFSHHFLNKYEKIVKYYQALDLYIISSRAEGGPKALLESWACKTPLISTPVGMVRDYGKNNENLIQIESIKDIKTTQKAIANGLHTVTTNLSLKVLSSRYFTELYQN